MNHPPYHLRPNKAVDRFILIELLRELQKNNYNLSEYTYYGFGGPFLEDCRLINQYFPDIRIVSLERDHETFKRQEFHKFTRNMYLENMDLNDFLANYSDNEKAIFWLDYTDLKYDRFGQLEAILNSVCEGSIVKITLRAHLPKEIFEKAERRPRYAKKFAYKYDGLLPSSYDEECFTLPKNYVRLIQNMVRLKAETALPAVAGGNVFQLLNSFYYSDGTTMLSLSGIVCQHERLEKVREEFASWPFTNMNWNDPQFIDLPILSIKERLHLEKLLPSLDDTCQDLATALGYKIGQDVCSHIDKLKNYKSFHRYYPIFAKIVA